MKISLHQLLSDQGKKLDLESFSKVDEFSMIERRHGQYSSELIGHFNSMHPTRVQVIGKEEWRLLSIDAQWDVFNTMLAAKPPALIFADNIIPSPSILAMTEKYQVPILRTSRSSAGVIDILRTYLSRRLADTVTMSGVMLDVLGLGVMITGESGLGKSELGLELITRGHGLVADDVTELAQIAPYTLEGRCPAMLRDFLEVRGLGILNVRLIFGETAIRRKMRLRLIINLLRLSDYQLLPRLPANEEELILGVPIKRVNLPVSSGRNLAVLVETAVRNTILILRGFNPSAELMRRHSEQLYSTRSPLPDPDQSEDD